MVLKSFGDRLRVYRTGKGFSQKGLGLAVGLKQGQISDLENSKNKKECDPKFFEKICMALDTTVDGLNNFGSSNTIYQNAIKHLNKKEAEIYTTFSSDQKSIESLLLTMNILFKINDEYKKLLDDCVKKSGRGGVK